MVVVIITIAGQKVRGAKARQGKAIERTMRLALITAIMGMRRRSSTPLIMLLIISIALITLLILSTALIAALISRNGGA